MPLVSICIPTYNYAAFLPGAIDSVLRQSCEDFELLIVDNCSTDETSAIAASYVSRDPRIRYVVNESNVGMAANFNRALQLACGEYVKVLCADDWLDPRAVELSVRTFARYPQATLVTTGRVLTSTLGAPIGLVSYARDAALVDGAVAIRRCLFGTNYIGEPSATMFPRRAAQRGFDVSYPHVVDLEMWFHLLEHGALVCIPDALTHVRVHEGQGTRSNMRDRLIVQDKKRLFDTYGCRAYVRKTVFDVARWRLRMAYNVWTSERLRHARGQDDGGVEEFVPRFVFYAALPLLWLLHQGRALLQRVHYLITRAARGR